MDRIDKYVITVDPNFSDGSLDINIDITWTVLDSSTEGPLEWVKIGVPNYHVENIKKNTSNIKDAYYYSDSGSFIRIDFNGSYQEGEKINFSFSFNQSYMYHINNDEIYYDYMPGYFNDILVDECILKWNIKNVKEINNEGFIIEGDYYTYSSPLKYGQTIDINLSYDKNSFLNIDPNKTYTDSSDPYFWVKITFFVFVPAALVLLILIIRYIKRDPYRTSRGFYGPSVYRPYPISRIGRRGGVSKNGTPINPPSSHGGRGGGGGCACACACAGGGRAGCSMKDYYHTNLKSNDVIRALAKGEDNESSNI